MSRRPYRIEMYFKNKRPSYYLVKEVAFKGRRTKVRKYLGMKKPTHKELERYRREYAYDIELRVAMKKAEMSCEFFQSDYLSNEQILKLEKIHFMYNAVTDLMTTSELKAYERDFEIHYISGTTQIEGNTLTLGQTRDLLESDILPSEKSLREVNEVQNFKQVIQFRNKSKGPVTLQFIKTIHALIMDNIDHESAGLFRRMNGIVIAGEPEIRVAPSDLIEEELQRIINDYYRRVESGHHPFEQAVLFHYYFELLHPFTDVNGRVGREILNYMLNRRKYPRLLFLGSDRDIYLRGLRRGNDEEYGEMISLFADIIMKQRFEVLEENLRKLAPGLQKRGQISLTDFIGIN